MLSASTRTTQWGIAWLALCVVLGLHVADEALTGFLPLYNSTVEAIRASYPWIRLPTFTFSGWLTGLIIGVLVLFSLSPMVFAGNPFLRPLAYFLGLLMTLNALAHTGISLYLGTLVPGTLSSPFLLLAAIALLVTTRRVRGATSRTGRDAR